MPFALVLCLWLTSGLATLLLWAAVSYRHDRRFVVSTWIKLWLAIMLLFGPLGTLLTLRTSWLICGDVRREVRRLTLPDDPRERQHAAESLPQKPYAPAGLPSLAGSRR